jgi:hypothetical protein
LELEVGDAQFAVARLGFRGVGGARRAAGAVTQAFHRVRPAWQGVGAAAILILSIQHPLEFALHGMRRTPHWRSGVMISMGFSVAASAVDMGPMRRGYLMVGEEPPVQRRRLRRTVEGKLR